MATSTAGAGMPTVRPKQIEATYDSTGDVSGSTATVGRRTTFAAEDRQGCRRQPRHGGRDRPRQTYRPRGPATPAGTGTGRRVLAQRAVGAMSGLRQHGVHALLVVQGPRKVASRRAYRVRQPAELPTAGVAAPVDGHAPGPLGRRRPWTPTPGGLGVGFRSAIVGGRMAPSDGCRERLGRALA